MVGWLALGRTVSLAFGSEDPLAPVEQGRWYHREITAAVASAVGWGPGAAAELGRHALGVDLYRYHPLWAAGGGRARRRAARWARQPLDNVHFDNLIDTPEIAEIWRRTIGGTLVGLDWAAQQDDVGAARQVIGVGLHGIQDFYSHSTWIDDPARRTRTWLQDDDARREPGLTTGGFGPEADDGPHRHGELVPTWRSLIRVPAMLGLPALVPAANRPTVGPGRSGPPTGLRYGPVPGINLDSRWQARIGVRTRHLAGLDADAAFEVALDCARRETTLWLQRLDQRFAERPEFAAFWARVRGGPELDWTIPYNDPAILAYDFIAAGRYPPRENQDSIRWFHRFLVEPGPTARGHRGRLRVLDRQGRQLLAFILPYGRAVVLGPAPVSAGRLELELPGATRVQVHAFRRAPEPVLQLLTDRSMEAPAGPFWLSIEPVSGTAPDQSP